MHDLVDIGIGLPLGQYATVAGLILEFLGHLPQAEERVTIEGYELEVGTVDRRSIQTVRITPTELPEATPQTCVDTHS
jgi:putative hemolysin